MYWLERGCHDVNCNDECKKINKNRTPRWANSTDAAGEIQCCSDTGVCTRKGSSDNQCFSGDGDQKQYTYSQAVEICVKDGKRLCTQAELLTKTAGGCCKAGCQLDGAVVWTSNAQRGLFILTCLVLHMHIRHPTPVKTFVHIICFTNVSFHCDTSMYIANRI